MSKTKPTTIILIAFLMIAILYLLAIVTGIIENPLNNGTSSPETTTLQVKDEQLAKSLKDSFTRGSSEQTKAFITKKEVESRNQTESISTEEDKEVAMKTAGKDFEKVNENIKDIVSDDEKKEVQKLSDDLKNSIESGNKDEILDAGQQLAKKGKEVKEKAKKTKKEIDNLHDQIKICQKQLATLEKKDISLLTNEEKIKLTELRAQCPKLKKEVEQKENEYADLQKTLRILAMLCRIAGSVATACGYPQVGVALLTIGYALESEADNFDQKATDGKSETEPQPGSPEPGDNGGSNSIQDDSNQEKGKKEDGTNDPTLNDFAQTNKPSDDYDVHVSTAGTSNIIFYSSIKDQKIVFKKKGMNEPMANFNFSDIKMNLANINSFSEHMLPAESNLIVVESFEKNPQKLKSVKYTAVDGNSYEIWRPKEDSLWELEIWDK